MDNTQQTKNYQQIRYDRVVELQVKTPIPDVLIEMIPSEMTGWLQKALPHHNTFTMAEPIEVFEGVAIKNPANYTMHEFVNACNVLSRTTAYQMGMTLTEWLKMRKKVGEIDAEFQLHQNEILKRVDKEVSDMIRSDRTRAELTNTKQIKLS